MSEKRTPRRVIQIAADSDSVEERLYILYDDSSIWLQRFAADGYRWEIIHMPEEDDENPRPRSR